MFPNQLYPILLKHFRDDALRQKSIFIQGPSGIGKSEMIKQIAKGEGVELRDKRLSQMDAVDLIGVPHREGKFTSWSPPDWLQFEEGSKGILHLDELTSASREVMAASYQLFLDREINGAHIPDTWMIIASGNRVSDRGVINQIPSPLVNRFVQLSCEPHLDSWRDWAGAEGVDPRIIAWVSHQAQFLHNFDPSAAQASEQFCTPRSITSAADYLDWPETERVEMLYGCLGKAGASNLESFLRLYTELPTRAEVEADPTGCRVPGEKELGKIYAMTMMCSAAMDRTNFSKFWQYVDRMGAMYIVLAVRLAMQRDKGIATAKGYRDFTSKHTKVFERK